MTYNEIFVYHAAAIRKRMADFDRAHQEALERMWFIGDIHGKYGHVKRALAYAEMKPKWLIFLGDIDDPTMSFGNAIDNLREDHKGIQVAFIHGENDGDSHELWGNLNYCRDAVPLHGRIVDLDGIRVAGLGGIFHEEVWGTGEPLYRNRSEVNLEGEWVNGYQQRLPALFDASIYPDDVAALTAPGQTADIFVSHEAPACHPHGSEILSSVARSLVAVRTFHSHHFQDFSEIYEGFLGDTGFDARMVSTFGIKNGFGEVVSPGGVSRRSAWL